MPPAHPTPPSRTSTTTSTSRHPLALHCSVPHSDLYLRGPGFSGCAYFSAGSCGGSRSSPSLPCQRGPYRCSFVDRWQPGPRASAWLHASRKDPRQRLKNDHFRVIVGGLLGINCITTREVHSDTPCPERVSPDVTAHWHVLRCRAVYTGDNDRRHNALQQRLSTEGANVICTPGAAGLHQGPGPRRADPQRALAGRMPA